MSYASDMHMRHFFGGGQQQTDRRNPYAPYQQSSRVVGPNQSAQQLRQGDWRRNFGVMQGMGVPEQKAGVLAGVPSSMAPLVGLQESEGNRVASENRSRVQQALTSLQQASGGVGQSPLGQAVGTNYMNLLQQGGALGPQVQQQMMSQNVLPGVDAAYRAQAQTAQGMGGVAGQDAMRRAQETRQNRVLEAQRALSIRSAEQDFGQRLKAGQLAGGYQTGVERLQQPYTSQQALMQATAAQEAPPDYSGLANLIRGGQDMRAYMPQFGANVDRSGSYQYPAGPPQAGQQDALQRLMQQMVNMRFAAGQPVGPYGATA